MKLKNLFIAATVLLFTVTSCEKEDSVTGISISPETATLTEAGATTTLTATLAPSGTKADVAWTSSNTAVATVSGSGLTATVTAVGAGTAEITATADIFTAKTTITVDIAGSGGENNGSENAPYTVTEAIANQDGLAWVEGYIIGYAWAGSSATEFYFTTDTCTQATNIIIANSKTETGNANILPVQLPSGAIRTGLNVKDVKANLGKKVKLYGSLEKYFGQSGLKAVSYYELEGGSTGGTKPADTSGAILNETFASGQGSFTIQDITIPEGGTYVWIWDSNYKYMKASAFISSAKASESWLISPAINLTGKTSANLSFEHTGKYFTSNKLTEQEVYVSTNYSSGAPSTATWTKLTVPAWPTGNDWTFVNSGDVSLSSVAGNSSVHIAFKYASTTAGAATWEVKNVLVK
ncbi:MAG: DUF6359 domain-containing protein [Paludibacteraceae bacterium]